MSAGLCSLPRPSISALLNTPRGDGSAVQLNDLMTSNQLDFDLGEEVGEVKVIEEEKEKVEIIEMCAFGCLLSGFIRLLDEFNV